MSKPDVIRAWKDEEYLHSLSEEERALLPQNPAGGIELTDEDLSAAVGGFYTITITFITVLCHTAIVYGEDLCFPAV